MAPSTKHRSRRDRQELRTHRTTLCRLLRIMRETSLLPRDGGFVLPVKQAVRTREQIDLGDTVTVSLSVAPRHGRAANGTGRTG